jgi:L-seryl-tRNA(Ser) seleniumtransferase
MFSRSRRVTSPFRSLPAVDALVRDVERRLNGDALPRELLVALARATLDETRRSVGAGGGAPNLEAIAETVVARARDAARPSLRPLINATGVILQTNLGRAPLSEAALAAMRAVGQGYSNLEYDLEAGARGSRYTHLAALLARLTGAEAALAVNNNAAAIYLALTALASGREVIVSRGQAVEIGGGFRIPDVLRQSGAALVEVGTTNRTYAADFEAAITERSALLLRVHTSNFQLTGFVHETPLAEMVAVGRARGVAVLDDLGSGTLLPTAPHGLAPEPTVQESVAAGADLVTFSGDKLLGGPQAGLIVGRAELVERLRRHPLARALRVDKTTIAGLEATLLAYLRGWAHEEIPVWRMIAARPEGLRARAERIATRLGAEVVGCASAVGGGSLPGQTLPSYAVAVDVPDPEALARALRLGEPAVVARIAEGRLLLDVRTVLPEQDEWLVTALRRVGE